MGKVCSITLRVVINTSPDRGETFPAGWKRSFNNLFPLHVGLSGGKTDLNNYQATVRAQRPENSPKLQCLNCPNVCCATSRKEHVMYDINNWYQFCSDSTVLLCPLFFPAAFLDSSRSKKNNGAIRSWRQMREALENCELPQMRLIVSHFLLGGLFSGFVLGGLERLAG